MSATKPKDGAHPSSLGRVFALAKPYMGRVLAAIAISIVISGANASLAWVVKPVTDGVLLGKDRYLLTLLPFAIFFIFLFRGAFNFLYEYLMQSAAQKLVMNLRNRLYGHIMSLPIGYFTHSTSGSLISRVLNDTKAVQDLISLTIKQLFVESATTVALIAYAFWLRWDLAIIAVILLPTAFWAAGRIARRLRLISRRIQEKTALIVEDLSESFTGIKIIKAFLREDDGRRHFTERNRDFYRENMRAVRVRELVMIVMELAGGLGVAFVLWYGTSLVVAGSITAGQFTSFITAAFLVYTPAKRLSRVKADLEQIKAPLERIFDVLALESEPEGGEPIAPVKESIEFKDVSFIYPGQTQPALDAVSFKVEKGEVVAIVGESGSGKTTLASLLPRFYRPSSGRITIDGTDISAAALSSLRAQFGYVSQEVILFNDTVRANIAFGRPGAPKAEIIEASKAAYAHEFITQMPQGYDTAIGEKGVRLSGGQRQRLSIARAILKNPPILILDEATSSLDVSSEMIVQKALENLMERRTTFVIAHRLSTIRRASKILVLEKGRVIAVGTHEELLGGSPAYRRLYELQFAGLEAT